MNGGALPVMASAMTDEQTCRTLARTELRTRDVVFRDACTFLRERIEDGIDPLKIVTAFLTLSGFVAGRETSRAPPDLARLEALRNRALADAGVILCAAFDVGASGDSLGEQ